MIVHRLTVSGKDYFLTDPVDDLRERILAAVQSGGDYVTIADMRKGLRTQILFSPGIPVTWVQLDVSDAPADTQPVEHEMIDPFDI